MDISAILVIVYGKTVFQSYNFTGKVIDPFKAF